MFLNSKDNLIRNDKISVKSMKLNECTQLFYTK